MTLWAEEELSERVEVAVRMLLNAVERLSTDNRSLADEVARLLNQLEQKKQRKTTGKLRDNDSRGNDHPSTPFAYISCQLELINYRRCDDTACGSRCARQTKRHLDCAPYSLAVRRG